MKFFGDFHIHSNYSDGRASIDEMVNSAVKKGLNEVGITDHGPKNIGTGVKKSETFLEIKRETRKLREKHNNINIYVGAEADIVSVDGDIDVSNDVIKELDYLLVGLHPYVMPNNVKTALNFVIGNQVAKVFPNLKKRIKNINTKAVVECLDKYPVYALTHPNLGLQIDIDEVSRACIKNNTAWEINTAHLCPTIDELIQVAKVGVDFIVNSDAHFPETVGELDYGDFVLSNINLDDNRIRNLWTTERTSLFQ